MTKQKGGGPSRPTSPQAAPKRPQLRPIAGAKPPALRPIAVRPATAPRPPANVKRPPPPEPPLEGLGDEESTSVMSRHVFDTARSLPAVAPRGADEPAPPSARPARPAIDIVPQTQRTAHDFDRTVVMPNAPARPLDARPRSRGTAIGGTPTEGRTSKSSRPPPKGSSIASPSASRSPMPSAPPLDDLIPSTARLHATGSPSSPPASTVPLPPLQDETYVMHRGGLPPPQAPVSFPPPERPPLGPIAPAARMPPSPAAAPAPLPLPMPGMATAALQHPLAPPAPQASAQGPGVFGFVFFAAPLALGTAIVAALTIL